MNLPPIKKNKIPWGALFALRAFVCVIALALHQATEHIAPVWIMLLLALYSLRAMSMRSNLTAAISVLVLLHTLWVAVLVAVYLTGRMPVEDTAVRWSVFTESNIASGILGGAQFLYMITLALEKMPQGIEFKKPNKGWLQTPLVIASLATSILINGFAFTIYGGYSGNTNIYWSGLPAIFIAVMAAIILVKKNESNLLLIFINLVVLYWILTGNRSEVLLIFILGNAFYLFSKPRFSSTKHRNAAAAAILPACFIIFTAVGITRTSGITYFLSSPTESIFSGITSNDRLNISTVGSSVYSGLAAIDISKKDGLYYGETFIGQIKNTIPSFIPTPWERYSDPYQTYQLSYQTMGGFGLLGESFLNFGSLGPILIGILLAAMLRNLSLQANRSIFFSWVLLSLVLYSQRYFFYGYVYLHNLVTLFIFPAAIIAIGNKIKRHKRTSA